MNFPLHLPRLRGDNGLLKAHVEVEASLALPRAADGLRTLSSSSWDRVKRQSHTAPRIAPATPLA